MLRGTLTNGYFTGCPLASSRIHTASTRMAELYITARYVVNIEMVSTTHKQTEVIRAANLVILKYLIYANIIFKL
jgi:hypothetical protein